MVRFLVDANLPKYFSFWSSDEYLHVSDLGTDLLDSQTWTYAKNNQLTIISKDSDFSARIINKEPPPKVIHVKIGNMKIGELYDFIGKRWEEILEMNTKCKLVKAYSDKILGVD
ncbi:DUF5615 family PIN-like protein [Pricia sp.]|uniref:DUF5615 family PIN-like protein n=1 Tax=Pricia sp. TaxID=2268138 RepID=UPI003593E97A